MSPLAKKVEALSLWAMLIYLLYVSVWRPWVSNEMTTHHVSSVVSSTPLVLTSSKGKGVLTFPIRPHGLAYVQIDEAGLKSPLGVLLVHHELKNTRADISSYGNFTLYADSAIPSTPATSGN